MDHHDALALAVGGVVGEVEALRLVEVELHGGDGLLVAAGVDHLDVELGTVERRLARAVDEVEPPLRQPDRVGRRRERCLRARATPRARPR